MEDCWHENPSVRLASLRIKKTLAKLQPFENSNSSLENINTYTSNKYNGISEN
jgi:hypothetical protein